MSTLRIDAESIWRAAVDAVRPRGVIPAALSDPGVAHVLQAARRIIVVGAGKAGAAMADVLEQEIPDLLARVSGLINVPAESVRPLQAIRLHAARPVSHNYPTPEGVAGAEQILNLVEQAGPDDIVLCMLSGGGSALLPLPVQSITLEDKQKVTQLLHACGANINEMNAVRKHLSRIKGGRLAQVFRGKALISFLISDVIGDPLDVIASGPTVPDPTTFADALAVLNRFDLSRRVPTSVLAHLQLGAADRVQETPKVLPENVSHHVLANNKMALSAAAAKAQQLGYRVLNLGSFIDSETRNVAGVLADIVQSIFRDGQPFAPPLCILSGGETTVTLAQNSGKGGRNQDFVLAAALKLGHTAWDNAVILSGGTDGEDGPTDAAGAFADSTTLSRAAAKGLKPASHLARNDAYPLFEALGDLFKPGLTETNVMDVRFMLLGSPEIH